MKRTILTMITGRFLIFIFLNFATETVAQRAPFVRISKFDTRKASQQEFRQLLIKYTAEASKTGDVVMAEIYRERDHENLTWLIERWSDSRSWIIFQQSEIARAVIAMNEKAAAKPAEYMAVKDLEPLSKESWQKTAAPTDKPFTVMLILKTKPGRQNEFISTYHAAMPKFRSEKGVVTYQLSQNLSDPLQFITYEKFRDEAAFQYHLKFPPITPVLNFLKSSIQNPPFEQGIHNLLLLEK